VANITVRLRLRNAGTIIEAPVIDLWPVCEVFALETYAWPGLPWADIQHVVDCGANVGAFSLWIALKTNARIFAVEPNPRAYPLFERNLTVFKGRVRLLRAVVAGQQGNRILHDSGFAARSSIAAVASGSSTVSVRAVTLEDIIKESGFPQIDLLKMDIEGAEEEVFASASPVTLGMVRTALIEFHPNMGCDPATVVAKLELSGMKTGVEGTLIRAWRPYELSTPINEKRGLRRGKSSTPMSRS
jgi:FkbM family methyltransferase